MAIPETVGLRNIQYLPEETNIWMYSIVAIGSAFIVFVLISVYLMWRSMRSERQDIERETLCEAEKLPAKSSITSLHSDLSFTATSP